MKKKGKAEVIGETSPQSDVSEKAAKCQLSIMNGCAGLHSGLGMLERPSEARPGILHTVELRGLSLV